MLQVKSASGIDQQTLILAREGISRFLDERPEFRDTKGKSLEDLMLYLEVEEGSEEWLPQFSSNTRTLSSLWHEVARNSGNKPDSSNVSSTEKTSTSSSVVSKSDQAGKTTNKRSNSSKVQAPKEAASEVRLEPENPNSKLEETQAPITSRQSEPKSSSDQSVMPASNNPAQKNSSKAPEAAVIEVVSGPDRLEDKNTLSKTNQGVESDNSQPENQQVISTELERKQARTALDTSVMQTSRAVGDGFALLKYREQQIGVANHTVEELTEALSQAKQHQADAQLAYNQALEELARLLATSLGPKASDFGKLFGKIANSGAK